MACVLVASAYPACGAGWASWRKAAGFAVGWRWLSNRLWPLDEDGADEYRERLQRRAMRASGLELRGMLAISRDMGVCALPQLVDIRLFESGR